MVQLTVNKVSLSGITRERVMLRTEATIKASRVMLWTETTIERKQGWTIMKNLQRIVDCLVSIGDSKSAFVPERHYRFCGLANAGEMSSSEQTYL